ncbi:MAG: rRNA maturation RNase YbeY [Bacteroidia bacterium]|nr:rRNA maturation RNase YbeY [Bacteroidia bacterium]
MLQPEINFINEKIKFELKGKSRIKKWITGVIVKEKHEPGTICYVFCSDKYLVEINKKYLKHNYYTDIITFDYTESKAGKGNKRVISGDIFISIDRVKENALDLGTQFDNELRRVIIHGVLHLMGYSDKTKKGQNEMRQKEDIYIKHFH